MAVLDTEPATSEMYDDAATFLRNHLPHQLRSPRVAIICGSGLGGLSETVAQESKAEIDNSTIPHFLQSTGESSTSADKYSYPTKAQV